MREKNLLNITSIKLLRIYKNTGSKIQTNQNFSQDLKQRKSKNQKTTKAEIPKKFLLLQYNLDTFSVSHFAIRISFSLMDWWYR